MIKSLADYIVHIKKAMPLEMCKNLIETYDSIHKEERVQRENKIMKFEEINMLDHPAFEPFRYPMGQLMQAVNNHYMKLTHNILRDRLPCYEPLKDYEAPRIKRYEPNQGIFDWHIDAANQETGKRVVVMFWYLNDVAEGGETIFDVGEEIAIKPEAGSVCVFPPTWNYPHKGATPISNPKYCISSYVWLPIEPGPCD
jgi:hypothetical protein